MSSTALPRAVGLETQDLEGIELTHSFPRSSTAPMAEPGEVLTLGPNSRLVGVSLQTYGLIDCLLPEFPPHPGWNCSPRDDKCSCQPLIYFNCYFFPSPVTLRCDESMLEHLRWDVLGAW